MSWLVFIVQNVVDIINLIIALGYYFGRQQQI